MDLVQSIISVLIEPALVALGAWLVNVGRKWVATMAEKEDNAFIRSVFEVLDETVLTSVLAIQQTVVKRLKEARADGVLEPDEIAAIRSEAASMAWEMLPQAMQDYLAKVAGGTDAAWAKFVFPVLERVVLHFKNNGGELNVESDGSTDEQKVAAMRARLGLVG